MAKHETFGERLQRLRLAAGFSQTQLAKAAVINVASIRNWEQGRRVPSIELAAKLAQAMRITLDELAGRATGKTS